MKIRSVHVYVVKLAESYLGGHESDVATTRRDDYVRHRHYRSAYSLRTESVLVKVVAEDGTYGWGEAQAPLAPEVTAEVVRRLVGPFLLGHDALEPHTAWASAYDAQRERGHLNGYHLDAIAACDIALWDLRGKLLGLSAAVGLGGRFHERVPCYVSGLRADAGGSRAEAGAQWQDRGFHRFKVALGLGVDEDERVVEDLRRRLEPGTQINVDAHWRYRLPEAIELGRRFERLGVGFLEAPIAPEDSLGQTEITRSLALPIAVGEELRTRYAFRDVLVERRADILQPDVGRMGISEAVAVASMAEAFCVPVAYHLGVGLGIYIAASVHTAAATRNLLSVEYQPRQLERANDLLVEPIAVHEGDYLVPDGPGLGVDLDVDRMREHVTQAFVLELEDSGTAVRTEILS